MLATDDVSDEGNDSDGAGNQYANMSTHISGDDLGDSFTIDEKPRNKKGWVDEILERNHAEDSGDEDDGFSDGSGDAEDDEGETEEEEEEEEEEDDEQVETLKDWEQSDDDVGTDFGGQESESDEEERVEDETLRRDEDKKNGIAVASERMGKRETAVSSMEKAKGGKQTSSLKLDLPFKIDAPANMDKLRKLFEGLSNEDIIEAVRRIRVCNAIPLAAENRKKTQV